MLCNLTAHMHQMHIKNIVTCMIIIIVSLVLKTQRNIVKYYFYQLCFTKSPPLPKKDIV